MGQDVPFTLISALHEGFFSDAIVKSSEGHQVFPFIHSPFAYVAELIRNRFFFFSVLCSFANFAFKWI